MTHYLAHTISTACQLLEIHWGSSTWQHCYGYSLSVITFRSRDATVSYHIHGQGVCITAI